MATLNNWAVFIVMKAFFEEEIEHAEGDLLVMSTTMQPSVSEYPQDSPTGMFLIAPKHYVQEEALKDGLSPVALTSSQVAKYVLRYWYN